MHELTNLLVLNPDGAAQQPVSGQMFAGDGVAVLHGSAAGGSTLSDDDVLELTEIFAWSDPDHLLTEADARGVLILRLDAPEPTAYAEWLKQAPIETMKAMWHDHTIYRHDVLVVDDYVAAYYECQDLANIFAAFGDDRATEVMASGLADVLDSTGKSFHQTLLPPTSD